MRFDLALTHQNLATFFVDESRLQEADAEFQKALEVLGPLVKECPDQPVSRRLLGRNHFFQGQARQAQGDLDGARQSWLEARPIQQELARQDPEYSVYAYDLALTLRSLSILSDARGQASEAETLRREAQAVEERLIREHPDSNSYYFDAAISYAKFAAPGAFFKTEPVDRQRFVDGCITHARRYCSTPNDPAFSRLPTG